MMNELDASTAIGLLAAQRPDRIEVFEHFGLDFYCRGEKPLADACTEAGIPLENVLSELKTREAQPPASEEKSWLDAGLAELCAHIESTHHVYLRGELPRLKALITKATGNHGDDHPELRDLREVFDLLFDDLNNHMMKEEQVLFPFCRQLDTARTMPEFHCGSVCNPIGVMISEHEGAVNILGRIRNLTRNFTAPPIDCDGFRGLLGSLAALEKDMHQHIHKENNILFPRAFALEQALQTDTEGVQS